MAVFMVGIVHATFIYDEDEKEGYYTWASSYVSGEFHSGKVYEPFYRSEAQNTTNLPFGVLYMEYYWYADGLWQHAFKYDINHQSYLSSEDSYSGDATQAICKTQAGYYYGNNHYPDTDWATAGIPFTP